MHFKNALVLLLQLCYLLCTFPLMSPYFHLSFNLSWLILPAIGLLGVKFPLLRGTCLCLIASSIIPLMKSVYFSLFCFLFSTGFFFGCSRLSRSLFHLVKGFLVSIVGLVSLLLVFRIASVHQLPFPEGSSVGSVHPCCSGCVPSAVCCVYRSSKRNWRNGWSLWTEPRVSSGFFPPLLKPKVTMRAAVVKLLSFWLRFKGSAFH